MVVAVGERLELREARVERENGASGACHWVDHHHVLARVVHVQFEEGRTAQLLFDHLTDHTHLI